MIQAAEKINRPLLTAGISYPQVHLSLDKLTIVGDLKNTSTAGQVFSASIDILNQTLAKFPYRYNYRTVSGCVIQEAEKPGSVPQIRIEFNPNNPDQSKTAHSILAIMKHKRPTRIDWALDYQQDLSQWLHTTSLARSSCVYYSQSGKLETIYLGSKHSQDKYRIYDKAKELGIDGTLWRVEHEMRFKPDDLWQLSLPFNDLFIVKPSPELHVMDQLVIDGLRRQPECWGQLSDKMKRKYRSLIKDPNLMIKLDPWPSVAYIDQSQPLTDYLTERLSE